MAENVDLGEVVCVVNKGKTLRFVNSRAKILAV